MDDAEVRTGKTEIDQTKMEYINFVYNEEITYWKKAALARVLNESEEKELVDLVGNTYALETGVFLYMWRLYFILWKSRYRIKHWSGFESLQ